MHTLGMINPYFYMRAHFSQWILMNEVPTSTSKILLADQIPNTGHMYLPFMHEKDGTVTVNFLKHNIHFAQHQIWWRGILYRETDSNG